MTLSVFDVFKTGIGPSSSHTVGPMWAGLRFGEELQGIGLLDNTDSIKIHLYGSLALTGVGHGTDKATLLGLSGFRPDSIDPDLADSIFDTAKSSGRLNLAGQRKIGFDYQQQVVFHQSEALPEHPNAMRLFALDSSGIIVHQQTYFSIGGGFIVTADKFNGDDSLDRHEQCAVPYPFGNAAELIAQCKQHKISIAELMYANELALHQCGKQEVDGRLDELWQTMHDCVERGMRQTGVMPVSGIKRRAADIYNKLLAHPEAMLRDHFAIMDWVTLFAMSVNEENACGGRVVTAPTNGAAGVIPAVISYYQRFNHESSPQGIRNFLLTAAAIGALYKMNASISGAEVGCQGEVGVACSMAAAGLAAVSGGNIDQIENAAEIGMEHHLGMTCDPINGLVQVPCIERNSMGAIKSITASRIAMRGNGEHEVPLDSVIETMYRTGMDIQAKYKETSQGGLAIYANKNHIAC
ncbi:L-serine dehydratase 2 [Sinobacterium norvegicum]|uniref:L-serine dehydratase n=1 Tax=Sinobacterium norvegicum TaxID=1641715 RepID=A0ABN8EFR6_9GAMM|nr:L-serine ammonia-lyase [Sinobacterium norvegicum]CAH0990565.1 L-serine dehydratase 2 [Sinobacterium norvegicum]